MIELRAIGWMPRLFSSIQLLAFGIFAWVEIAPEHGMLWAIVITLPPAIVFGASLRIRAQIVDDSVVIHSYWKTWSYSFRQVSGFSETEYDGVWTLGRPTSLLSQLDVHFHTARNPRSLHVAMCGRGQAKKICHYLNALAGAPEGDDLWHD